MLDGSVMKMWLNAERSGNVPIADKFIVNGQEIELADSYAREQLNNINGGDVFIDDNVTSVDKVWSSQKVSQQLQSIGEQIGQGGITDLPENLVYFEDDGTPEEDSEYILPIATNTTLGGVKAVAKTEEMTEEVGVDVTGKLYVKPSTSGGSGTTSSGNEVVFAGDLLASGSFTQGVAVSVNTGITKATLLQYKSFEVILKGASNVSLSNLYIGFKNAVVSSNKQLLKLSTGGLVLYCEFIDTAKTKLMMRALNGNPSQINSNLDLVTNTNTNFQMQYCPFVFDFDNITDTETLYFACSASPSIEYNYKIYGVLK